MSKYTVSFLGRDRPGVVAAISVILGEGGNNIVAVSQTILYGEFAAIFIVQSPPSLSLEQLREDLVCGLAAREIDLSVLVRPAVDARDDDLSAGEPFVVSVDGPDGPGLIGAMSRIFSRHAVNIESLKAVLGDGGEGHALFVFEVRVPEKVDLGRLRRELQRQAQALELRVSVQHRDIFEAVHRVNLV